MGTALGTTVNVTLQTAAESLTPDAQDGPPQDIADPSGTARDTGARRVLIVEDHADTGAMLALFLKSHGYDVTVATTLAEGLAQLPRRWDVVVSDIGLADGSGLEIGREAQRLRPPPGKLIALSGYGSLQDIGMSLHAGFDDHLVKPVDLQELLRLMA